MYDVLVAGEINPDLILSGADLDVRFDQVETLVERADLTIGSSSVIFACGAARLGLNVALTGVIGDDFAGNFMLQAVQQAGIDVSHVIIDPAVKTGITVILSRQDDRALLTFPGAISALRAEQVSSALLAQSRHLHAGSYYLQTSLQPGLAGLFERARRLGVSTSLDPNWDPGETWGGLQELLPLLDLFLPNQAEALAIAKADRLELAFERLGGAGQVVAVKQGASGAAAWQGGRIVRSPGLTVRVADSVGAGDSFDAGFVYGFLMGWSLERCLRLGVVCGSLSTRMPGGTQGQPTLAEALAAMRQLETG